MTFDKTLYWARRRNKNEIILPGGRKVFVDHPLRGQGDKVKRGKLVSAVGGNRNVERIKSVSRDFTKKGYRFGNQIRKSVKPELRLIKRNLRESGERERVAKLRSAL